MKKQTITATLLTIAAAFVLSTSAHASLVTATTSSYDSPNGYDYVTNTPPTSYQLIGTFAFTIPNGDDVTSVTISGSFGNGDVPNTELSDYYLGFSGNEEAVQVASCDDISADCYSGQEGPYGWTATLTQAQIATLAPALTAGSIDFTYTWDASPPVQPVPDFFSATGYDDQYVYAGAATLGIEASPAPEPATVLFCFSGLAGLAALRRFRKR